MFNKVKQKILNAGKQKGDKQKHSPPPALLLFPAPALVPALFPFPALSPSLPSVSALLPSWLSPELPPASWPVSMKPVE